MHYPCRTRSRLRLRDAGVAPEIVCEYLNVEEPSLEGLYRMAEAKLSAARHRHISQQRATSLSRGGPKTPAIFVRRN